MYYVFLGIWIITDSRFQRQKQIEVDGQCDSARLTAILLCFRLQNILAANYSVFYCKGPLTSGKFSSILSICWLSNLFIIVAKRCLSLPSPWSFKVYFREIGRGTAKDCYVADVSNSDTQFPKVI